MWTLYRLGRVLCHNSTKWTWQSTLPSLFHTSMAEYSAKSISYLSQSNNAMLTDHSAKPVLGSTQSTLSHRFPNTVAAECSVKSIF